MYDNKPTEAQLKVLREIGVEATNKLTRSRAAALITAGIDASKKKKWDKSKGLSPAMEFYLRSKDIDTTGMSYQDAFVLISKLKDEETDAALKETLAAQNMNIKLAEKDKPMILPQHIFLNRRKVNTEGMSYWEAADLIDKFRADEAAHDACYNQCWTCLCQAGDPCEAPCTCALK